MYIQVYRRSISSIARIRENDRLSMASLLDILLILTSILAVGNAHNIQMKAHSRECFHEQLHKDDKMTVTFQVGDREFGGSGNLDIDFWVGDFPWIRQGLAI